MVEVLFCQILGALGDGGAGVVDQHIHPAVLLHDGVEQVLNGLRLGDIRGNTDGVHTVLLADLCCDCIALVLLTAADHDGTAIFCQCLCNSLADALGGTGDNTNFALHINFHDLFPP